MINQTIAHYEFTSKLGQEGLGELNLLKRRSASLIVGRTDNLLQINF